MATAQTRVVAIAYPILTNILHTQIGPSTLLPHTLIALDSLFATEFCHLVVEVLAVFTDKVMRQLVDAQCLQRLLGQLDARSCEVDIVILAYVICYERPMGHHHLAFAVWHIYSLRHLFEDWWHHLLSSFEEHLPHLFMNGLLDIYIVEICALWKV